MRMMRTVLAALVIVSALRVVRADALDPEQERKSFHLADGWEIHLFAADPMVVKPIGINWDNKGRLWVASSETYPQLKPGQVPDDKIFVLEDTKGEGKADKGIKFADGLFIPNAVAPGDGGAYVTNSTEVLHFDESPQTGLATNRRVVLNGFGTEDTHQTVHALRWGYDGRLYFNQSIYIHSHLQTPYGTKTLLGSGGWRLEPRTMKLEVLIRGLINPWGVCFDRWGRIFETDGAGFGGIYYAYPGAAFESAVGYEKVLPSLNTGQPKYCSEEILTGRAVPDDYQGDIITNDFRAHRMVRFKLHPQGSGFTDELMPDFLTSTDPAFRPVDVRLGPDGALYVADWYNPIIQHGEVDFRDPRRDHQHGRIWRITYKRRPLVERPKIAGQSVESLLELLKLPEDYTRLHAKLELRERDASAVAPALATWVQKLDPKDGNFEHNLVEALWTCEVLDSIDAPLLGRLLSAHDPRARAAAVRVAAHWNEQLPAGPTLAKAIDDPDPQVRLEAISGLTRLRESQSIVVACRALDQPRDAFIDYALWEAANDLKDLWLPAMESGKLKWSKPEHLTFALLAIKSPDAIARVVDQLKSGNLPEPEQENLINLLATLDPAGQADTLFDLALGNKSPVTTLRLLDALRSIAKDHRVQPKNNIARIASLFDAGDESVRTSAMRLAGTWKLEAVRPKIASVADDASASVALRAGALQALANLGGDQSVKSLTSAAEPPSPPLIRCAAVAALAGPDLADAVTRAAHLLAEGDADSDPSLLLSAFIHREDAADALAKALASQKLSSDTAKLSLRYLQEQSSATSALADAFRSAAGQSSGPTKLDPEQMKALVAEVAAKGDPARGEQIFRRTQTGCYQCHGINGVGGILAPDLGSLGASSPVDYLIDSIYDPNKAIKDGYMGYLIVTKSGDAVTGIKVRQDNSAVVLRDNLHDQIVIPRADIRREKEIGSLMPVGLADSLTHGEFVDLVRFVSELGRPGPYAPNQNRAIRRWHVMGANASAAGATSATASDVAVLPAYSLVNGDLPPSAMFPDSSAAKVTLEAQLDVASPGPIGLKLNALNGLALCIDGKPLQAAPELKPELSAGRHTLRVEVSRAERGQTPLRVELFDVPGSSGRATAVGGR